LDSSGFAKVGVLAVNAVQANRSIRQLNVGYLQMLLLDKKEKRRSSKEMGGVCETTEKIILMLRFVDCDQATHFWVSTSCGMAVGYVHTSTLAQARQTGRLFL
jgi:hypothetical protein